MRPGAARLAPSASPLSLALVALPALGALYQVAATMTARASLGAARPLAWLMAAAATPWCWVLILSEIASFVVWTAVLARMPLSRAFPVSAVGYVVVVAVAVLVLREPLRPAALLGSATILAGAALLATDAS